MNKVTEEILELSCVNIDDIFLPSKRIFIIDGCDDKKIDIIVDFMVRKSGNIICLKNSEYSSVLPGERVYYRYATVLKRRLFIDGAYIFYDYKNHHFNKEKFDDLYKNSSKCILIIKDASLDIIKVYPFDYYLLGNVNSTIISKIYEIFELESELNLEDFETIINNIISEGGTCVLKNQGDSLEFLYLK